MPIVEAFKAGIGGALRERKMVTWLYGLLLLFALLLTLPAYGLLSQALGRSRAAEGLFEGVGLPVLVELLHDSRGGVEILEETLLWGWLAYLLLGTFLAGGTLLILAGREPFTLEAFFRGCGRYFLRFLRLFLISLLGLGVAFLLYLPVRIPLVRLAAQTDLERLPLILAAVRWGWLLFLLLLVEMIFDYARISTVLQENQKMLRTAWRAVKFVFRNFRRTLGLALLFLAVGLGLLALYWQMAGVLPSGWWVTVVTLILWQQLYILFRNGLRVAYYAGELVLYRGLVMAPEPPASGEYAQAQDRGERDP